MECQGVHQTIESGGKPLVEVRGVFLVGMANEVEISTNKPRTGDRRKDGEHLVNKGSGEGVICGA
jgi:hypothetical protein